MEKIKPSKTVTLKFRKQYKTVNRKQYEREFREQIQDLEDLGIIVQDSYFSKSSESIYVSFTLNSYNEERLKLVGKQYIGQFAISGHQRFYTTPVKTFLIQSAKDTKDLFKRIKEALNSALANKNSIDRYLVVMSERELEALRIIDKLSKEDSGFEVDTQSFMTRTDFPLFYMDYENRNLIKRIEDNVTNDFLLTLRYKNCIQAYNEGTNKRSKITLTSLGYQLLLQYGDEPNETLWKAFNNRQTFDLWYSNETTISLQGTPIISSTLTTDELEQLSISEEWYSGFEPLFYKLQQEVSLNKEEQALWTKLLSYFVEDNLPDNQEFINIGYIPSKSGTPIYIGEDSEAERATIYQIYCANYARSTEYHIGISFSNKRPAEFLQELTEILLDKHDSYLFTFTEDDLRTYLQLQFLEHSKAVIATTEFALNSKTTLELEAFALPIFLEQRLKKKTTLSKDLEDTNLARMLKLLYRLNLNDAITVSSSESGLLRLVTTPSSDDIFRYVESEMLYVRDNVLYEDKPEYPIVQDVEKGLITYVNLASLLSVQ